MATHYIFGSVHNGLLLSKIPELIHNTIANTGIRFVIHLENSDFVIKLFAQRDDFLFRGIIELIQNFLDEICIENYELDTWNGFNKQLTQIST